MAHGEASGMQSSGMRRRGSRKSNKSKIFPKRYPFDLTLAETTFPGVTPGPDESDFTQALLRRNSDLIPTLEEKVAISKLVGNIQVILDNLMVSSGNSNSFRLEEVWQVGSYKKDTMLKGHNVAAIVVILNILPSKEAVQALANKLQQDLEVLTQSEMAEEGKSVTCNINKMRIEVANSFATVNILVTSFRRNILNNKIMLNHLYTVYQYQWFENNVNHLSIKVLIRLLRDIQSRFDGLKCLSNWMIDLLAHFASMNNSNHEALPINKAFRRVFQLLASGLFLPGSSGIVDPCKKSNRSIHEEMSLEQQDVCCLTAQTLLRVLSHGGYKEVLGLEYNQSLTDQPSIMNGVEILPLETVYNKSSEKKKDVREDEYMEVDDS